jgi:hypothetical protein
MIANAWARRNDDFKLPRNPYLKNLSDKRKFNIIYDYIKSIRYLLCTPSFFLHNCTIILYQIGLRNHHLNPEYPQGPLLAYGFTQGDMPPYIVDDAWSIFRDELVSFNKLVTQSNAELIITFLPCRFYLSNHWRDNLKAVPKQRLLINPVDRIIQICAANNIKFVDAKAALVAERSLIAKSHGRYEPLFILGDYNHFNHAGHRSIAKALYNEM